MKSKSRKKKKRTTKEVTTRAKDRKGKKIKTNERARSRELTEASQYEITGQLGLVPDARLHGP